MNVIFEELPFENSNNKCCYISDTQFVVFNKYLNCYIPSESRIERAKKFLDYYSIDKTNNSIVVSNEEGCFLIDKNGRIAGPYDFIGDPCRNGFRPVKKTDKTDAGKYWWGYLPPIIDPKKSLNLFSTDDCTFFVATKVGGYLVNGRDYEDYKCQWLVYPKQNKRGPGRIPGILHTEFKCIPNSFSFFVGISKNTRGNDLFMIYRTNKNRNTKILERPYNSPDLYLKIKYLGASRFEVLQRVKDLKSILYFDETKKEFLYWPETDRRSFKSYRFSRNKEFLIAEKEDGHYSIIDKEHGDLTIFWQSVTVDVDANRISYKFNDSVNSSDFDSIVDAFNETVTIIKNKAMTYKLTNNEASNNLDDKTVSVNQGSSRTLDWIIYLKRKIYKYNNYYQINTAKSKQIKRDETVLVIDNQDNRLLYGTINYVEKKYYCLSNEAEVRITKDFSIFRDRISSNTHIWINESIGSDIEASVYNILNKINGTSTSNADSAETIPVDDSVYLSQNDIISIYKQLNSMNISDEKIFPAFQILFEDSVKAVRPSGISMLSEYANSHILLPDFNQIVDEIKENLTEEEKFQFSNYFKLGENFRGLDRKESIIFACKFIKENYGISFEKILQKLEPRIPNVTVDEYLKSVCLNRDDDTKKEQIDEAFSIQNEDCYFEYGDKKFLKGSKIPDELLNNRRIYFKNNPGIIFIKIDDTMIISGTIPKRFRIKGVGQGIQEFMPKNENTRIRDSRAPIVLIKKDKDGNFILYDFAQYESHEMKNVDNGNVILFTLRSKSKENM